MGDRSLGEVDSYNILQNIPYIWVIALTIRAEAETNQALSGKEREREWERRGTSQALPEDAAPAGIRCRHRHCGRRRCAAEVRVCYFKIF